MRLLISGGRDFDNAILMHEILLPYIKSDILIHGGARGADSLAALWANYYGIKQWVFKPNWNELGRSAGMIRNKDMLIEGKPDLVIAFPTAKSIGTHGMIKIAKKAGVRTIVV